jgi:hypothetical protein
MGAGLILMLRVEVADWDEGRVEYVTLMVADDVPIEFCAGLTRDGDAPNFLHAALDKAARAPFF